MKWQTKAAFQIVCAAVVVVVICWCWFIRMQQQQRGSGNEQFLHNFLVHKSRWRDNRTPPHNIVEYHCICIPRVLERLYTPSYI
jgi:hypothetical protein